MSVTILSYYKSSCKIPIIVICILAFISCSSDDKQIEEEEIQTGDILLYSKNPNGHNELYKLENGVESPILSDDNFDYWWPKVSPDKKKMLVYRSAANPDKNHDDYANAELILCNIDGTTPKVIIEKNKHGWISQGVCRWNKDGTKILMGAEIDTNGSVQWRLVVTDLNGEQPKILSNYWGIDCNFSIDNAHIYFIGFANNDLTTDLTKFELQRGEFDSVNDTLINIISLTSNNTRDHDPDISPDNTKAVFSAGNAEYSDVDLVLYDLITQKETTLLDDEAANGGSMCWSPDGKSIYFHSLNLFKSPFEIKKTDVGSGISTSILKSDGSFGYFHPEVY